jgi:hypothetical protein
VFTVIPSQAPLEGNPGHALVPAVPCARTALSTSSRDTHALEASGRVLGEGGVITKVTGHRRALPRTHYSTTSGYDIAFQCMRPGSFCWARVLRFPEPLARCLLRFLLV